MSMAGNRAGKTSNRGNENAPSPAMKTKNQDGGIDGLHEKVRSAIASLLQHDADIMKSIVAVAVDW